MLLLELLAQDLLVELSSSACDGDGLWETTGSHQLNLSLLLVLGQIKGRPIGVSSDLDPAVAGLDLSVPTVVSVVSHLVGTMLAEPNGLSLDAKTSQELVGASDEVTNGLVAYDTSRDSVTDRHHSGLSLAGLLSSSTPEGKLLTGKGSKLLVSLVLRVDKVLDFSHRELSDSEQALTRRDLVTEAKADLRGSEGHTAIVELNQAAEVDEDALSSLRSQVTLLETSGANLCVKHEVEGDSRRERVSRVRVLDVHPSDDLIDLLCSEVLNVGIEGKQLFSFVFLLALGQLLHDELLDDLVGASGSTCLQILDHKVFKFFDMA